MLLFAAIGFGANQYIFSIRGSNPSSGQLGSGKVLCTANVIYPSGHVDIQMRCYDTTVANPSWRVLFNTTISDSVVTTIIPWVTPGIDKGNIGWITCSFSRITTDAMGVPITSTPGSAKSMQIYCIDTNTNAILYQSVVTPTRIVTGPLP